MNCTEIQEELFEYLDGNLPPARRADFERHLESCHACSLFLAQHRSLNRELSTCFRHRTRNMTLSRPVRLRVLTELEQSAAVVRSERWFLPFWKRVLVPSGLAACLLCVVLVVTGRWSGSQRVARPSLHAAEPPISVSQTVPRVVTKYIFSHEGQFVVDALVGEPTIVQQTLRSAPSR